MQIGSRSQGQHAGQSRFYVSQFASFAKQIIGTKKRWSSGSIWIDLAP